MESSYEVWGILNRREWDPTDPDMMHTAKNPLLQLEDKFIPPFNEDDPEAEAAELRE